MGPDGEPLEDTTEIQSAIMVRHKLRQQKVDLLGLAAPKRSMSLQATVELDSENRGPAGRSSPRRTAPRWPRRNGSSRNYAPSSPRRRPAGPPALTLLAGKTEAPDGH